MNQRMTYVALGLYAAAYIILFSTWVAIAFNSAKIPHPEQIIGYIQDTLAFVSGHVITMINSSPSVPTVINNAKESP